MAYPRRVAMAGSLVSRLRERVTRPLTRFAPAPTGLLHLGHVVNAIYVWGVARALGGRVALRIEDHDRQRSSREHESALLDDLDWLGFSPDLHPTSAFRGDACDGRQSERGDIYRAALAGLVAQGSVYACQCSRADIERAAPLRASADELYYPGTCRDRAIALGDSVGWRVRIGPGVEPFEDGLAGPHAHDPAEQCGDVLLRDRLGNWTYQAAATIDDFVQDVTLVIRGVDLLASTSRQIRLARMLGRREPAVFVHHPLVMKSPTQKLSKSDGDTGVRALRAAGWSAAAVIGHAAAMIGLQETERPLAAPDVAALFQL